MGIVSIEKCSDYNLERVTAILEKTFENLGGIEKFIKPGMKVALKPNLVSKHSPEEAATTHPSMVQALSRLIKRCGGTVLIAESPFGLYNESVLRGVYSACGMEKAAAEEEIVLNYDLEAVEVDNPAGKYLKKVTVLKPLWDADIIINLPKLKTHGQMTYTGAVKNMFGAVPGVLKAEYHLRMPEYDEFANTIIDIFLSIKPSLNIMDAVIGMDGNGPTAGSPKPMGLILAGENGFEVDLAAVKIIDASIDDVPVIKQAVERNLCPADPCNIEIRGEALENVVLERFVIPGKDSMRVVRIYKKGWMKPILELVKPKPVFSKEACTGCRQCERHCPAKVIEMKNNKAKVNLSKCIRCFCCQEICPAKAVAIKRPFLTKILIKNVKKANEKKDFCR